MVASGKRRLQIPYGLRCRGTRSRGPYKGADNKRSSVHNETHIGLHQAFGKISKSYLNVILSTLSVLKHIIRGVVNPYSLSMTIYELVGYRCDMAQTSGRFRRLAESHSGRRWTHSSRSQVRARTPTVPSRSTADTAFRREPGLRVFTLVMHLCIAKHGVMLYITFTNLAYYLSPN